MDDQAIYDTNYSEPATSVCLADVNTAPRIGHVDNGFANNTTNIT
jgi:hypothetical protein